LFCLFDLNSVAYHLTGVMQLFSSVILLLCAVLLINYRFTVYRDLGTSGRLFALFMFFLLAIGAPIGLSADAAGLIGRWQEVRLLLAAALIVFAAAVGARGVLLAYGPRTTLRLLFVMSLAIPLAVWLSTYFPDFYRFEPGQSRDLSRATGTFSNPNEAAAAVCLTAVVMFSFMVTERSTVSSLLATGGLTLAALAIYLTGSRGGFVVFLALSLLQIVVSPGLKRLVVFFVAGSIVAVLLYAVYHVATVGDATQRSTIERMDTLWRVVRGEVTDETTGGRLQLAMNGIEAWMQSPLLGNGLGTQRRVGAANVGPHNTYIRVGGEAGVIPLAILLAFLLSLFWYSWTCKVPAVRTFGVSFAIVTTMVCMTGHNVITSREHNVMLGVCCGLLAGCLQMQHPPSRHRRPLPGGVPRGNDRGLQVRRATRDHASG
jgi:O-antigen ligase